MPQPAFAPAATALDGLVVQLEPRHLGRTMLNATFGYQLVLENRGAGAIGPLAVSGDIASAHGSRTAEEQLSPAGAPPLHEVPVLAPGESVSLRGELRLPMGEILPVRNGSAEFFVPLARFRIEDRAQATSLSRVFLVGQPGTRADGALRPFRIETLWNVAGPLAQREVAV